jgi:hypothetical protein
MPREAMLVPHAAHDLALMRDATKMLPLSPLPTLKSWSRYVVRSQPCSKEEGARTVLQQEGVVGGGGAAVRVVMSQMPETVRCVVSGSVSDTAT